MCGVWGIVVANAPKNLPVETRGLASGILAHAYAVGYLVLSIMSNCHAQPLPLAHIILGRFSDDGARRHLPNSPPGESSLFSYKR
jgi:hypothetical protein